MLPAQDNTKSPCDEEKVLLCETTEVTPSTPRAHGIYGFIKDGIDVCLFLASRGRSA